MNRKEYLESGSCSVYHYKSRKLLNDWKIKNNITEICDVHHRDDTEETINYNNKHYELWGFNEDGTFEYGKYVVFLTRSEHAAYHGHQRTGEKCYMYGKHHTDESKAKISAAKKGQTHTEDVKAKMSATRKGENNPFYGKTHTHETKARISAANRGRVHTDETKARIGAASKGRVTSDETKAKIGASRKVQFEGIKFLYNAYKNNGGILKWNDFQKALATGDITFSDYTITVFNDA